MQAADGDKGNEHCTLERRAKPDVEDISERRGKPQWLTGPPSGTLPERL